MLIKDKDDWLSSQENDTSEEDQSLAKLMRNNKKRKMRSSVPSTVKRKKAKNAGLAEMREKFASSSSPRDDTSDTEIEVEPNRARTSSGKDSKHKRPLISTNNASIRKRKRNTVSKSDAETGAGGLKHMCGLDTTEDSDSDLAPEKEVVRPFGSMPLVPQTTRVDDRQREKIRKGMYVDFRTLMPHPKGKVPPTRFTINNGLFEEVADSEDLNIYSWIDAFVIYMSVRLEFFPAEAQGLLRHLQIVKKMHSDGREALDYDEQFRRLKAQHKDIRWGEYLVELASDSVKRSPFKKINDKRTRSYGLSIPKRPCGFFNSPRGCLKGLQCRFPYVCKRCSSKDHPEFRCTKR